MLLNDEYDKTKEMYSQNYDDHILKRLNSSENENTIRALSHSLIDSTHINIQQLKDEKNAHDENTIENNSEISLFNNLLDSNYAYDNTFERTNSINFYKNKVNYYNNANKEKYVKRIQEAEPNESEIRKMPDLDDVDFIEVNSDIVNSEIDFLW